MAQRSSNRRYVIIALAIIALLCALWVWKRLDHPRRTQRPSPVVTRETPEILGSVPRTNTQQPAALTTAPSDPVEKKRLAVNAKNVPMNFWGRVVDQNDTPLQGVQISARIRRWHLGPLLNPEGGFTKETAVSRIDGSFEITGASGDVLTIEMLDKEGYTPEPGALRSFGYNISTNIVADPNRPVVLRMWKQELKQQLVSGDKFFPVNPDGRVYTVDLTKGELIESASGGDLRFLVKRDPEAKWGKKYDWSFKIEAINGGLKEESDPLESMYLAPNEGYTNVYTFNLSAGDSKWGVMAHKRFYLMAGNGQKYSRMDIEVYPYYLKDTLARFSIKYVLNPNSSRILR